MSETYCGKTCAECGRREELNCPGCKAGPGRPYDGDCILAKCTRKKGHETCETCIYSNTCGTLRGRESMPDQRIRKMEADKQHKAMLVKRAEVMGKWLWILFWLVVPGVIAGVLGSDLFAESASGLYMAGQIIGVFCSLAYGLILLKLRGESDGYRIAGICTLIACVLSACASLAGKAAVLATFLTIPAGILGLVATYHEYISHSAVLVGIDDELSEKWGALWRWEIGCYGALVGGTLLVAIAPVLGLIVMFAAATGLLVLGILKLIYVYRTAKIFREYDPA